MSARPLVLALLIQWGVITGLGLGVWYCYNMVLVNYYASTGNSVEILKQNLRGMRPLPVIPRNKRFSI